MSLENGDKELARKVIKDDRKIDLTEVEIEEACLKILALYQPVAVDLRHIIAILKINDDLERIADFGSNIAQRVLDLTIEKPLELMPNLPKMFAKVEIMLEKSVDSIFEKDKAMAVKVLKLDCILLITKKQKFYIRTINILCKIFLVLFLFLVFRTGCRSH